VRLRPVNLRFCFGLSLHGRAAAAAFTQNVRAHTLGLIHLDGTRVGLLLGHAYLDQSIQNFPALHFQLTC
jgi:hypothetical protein